VVAVCLWQVKNRRVEKTGLNFGSAFFDGNARFDLFNRRGSGAQLTFSAQTQSGYFAGAGSGTTALL
jgi:hypothetical protein